MLEFALTRSRESFDSIFNTTEIFAITGDIDPLLFCEESLICFKKLNINRKPWSFDRFKVHPRIEM